MKKELIALLGILGFTIEAKESEFELTSEHVQAMKAKAESAVSLEAAKVAAETAKATAEGALATLQTEKAKVDTDLAAALTAKTTAETKVTELEAKVVTLGKLPGAGSIDPNASTEEGEGADWRTDEVKSASHNRDITGLIWD